MSDYSEIVVLLDRSGSMQAAKADHEGGLQSFVKDQKVPEDRLDVIVMPFPGRS